MDMAACHVGDALAKTSSKGSAAIPGHPTTTN